MGPWGTKGAAAAARATAGSALRVRVGWGDYPIIERILSPPRRFVVGDLGADLVLPPDVLGAPELEVVDASGRRAFGKPLERGDSRVHRVGAFTVEVRSEAPPDPWPPPRASWRLAGFAAAAASLCLGLLTLAAFAPKPRAEAVMQEQIRLVRTFLAAAEARESCERAVEPVPEENADNREGGGLWFMDRLRQGEIDAALWREDHNSRGTPGLKAKSPSWYAAELPHRDVAGEGPRSRAIRSPAAMGWWTRSPPTSVDACASIACRHGFSLTSLTPAVEQTIDASSVAAGVGPHELLGLRSVAPFTADEPRLLASTVGRAIESPVEPDAPPLAPYLESAPSPFDSERRLVRVRFQAKPLWRHPSDPAHLVFLVDTSFSARRNGGTRLAAAGLRELVSRMRPTDTVAVVTWYGPVQDLVPPTPSSKLRELDLNLGWETGPVVGQGFEAALRLAFRHAGAGSGPDALRRVFVVSDGELVLDAALERGLPDDLAAHVARGITLSAIRVGKSDAPNHSLPVLARSGRGSLARVRDPDAARLVFAEIAAGGPRFLARDTRLGIVFDPSTVHAYRALGDEPRLALDQLFRDPSPDAEARATGAVARAGQHAAMIFEIVQSGRGPPAIAVHLDWRAAQPGAPEQHATTALRPEAAMETFAEASADFRFATAMAGLAERLRGRPRGAALPLDELLAIARDAAGSDRERQALVVALERLRTLAPAAPTWTPAFLAEAGYLAEVDRARAAADAELWREFGATD